MTIVKWKNGNKAKQAKNKRRGKFNLSMKLRKDVNRTDDNDHQLKILEFWEFAHESHLNNGVSQKTFVFVSRSTEMLLNWQFTMKYAMGLCIG